jgi:hypothetical protein
MSATITTANTIPGFKSSEFYQQAKTWHDHFVSNGPIREDQVDPNYESPDHTDTTHRFELRDDQGNGYTMEYDYRRSLKVEITKDGRQVFCETFGPSDIPNGTPWDRFSNIEDMVLTARSVGQAILDDEFEGGIGSSFCDGYATLADRLDMDFELADPDSNEWVRCSLNVVAPDKKHYEIMLTFTIPSMDLWAATDHLTTLCM